MIRIDLLSRVSCFFLRSMILAGALAYAMPMHAEVKLALPFSDHMVLQCKMSVPVWGEADPGDEITVEFAGQKKTTKTPVTGKWMVVLDPLPASDQPRVLKVKGNITIVLEDVLVGEVWLCSGQSNMEASLMRLKTAGYGSSAEAAEARARIEQELTSTTPGLRLFRSVTAKSPAKRSAWMLCDPAGLANPPKQQGFSALAYFFGKELQATLRVPVGLMEAAVGGTRIESWTPPEAYAELPVFRTDTASVPLKIDGVAPGNLFYSLVQPLAPFAVRGVIWYQGESNLIDCGESDRYADKMQALIQGWRSVWGQPTLPFYYVQLPGYVYSNRRGKIKLSPLSLPEFRESQQSVLKVPHTGMAVTADLPTGNNMHPGDKWDVAHRLVLLALNQTYGQPDVVCSGPVYRSMAIHGNKIVLTFDHVGEGLASKNGKALSGFSIAGADKRFVPAQAVINGAAVTVYSPNVTSPVAVRFCWDDRTFSTLSNRAGLPAAPFRTDNWEEKKMTAMPAEIPAEIPEKH